MYKIKKVSNHITADQTCQILDLVSHNANLISVNVFQLESPIYPYLSMREIIKTREYLMRLGDSEPRATHLIITEDSGVIIGYILYHRSLTSYKDIAIISTIVNKQYRNQGILKKMMNILQNENDSISLTCFVNRVPLYEKLGFQVFQQDSTQICLYYGYEDDGNIISVDDKYVDQIDSVINAKKKFQDDNLYSWQAIWSQVGQDNNTEIKNAASFIQSRNYL